MKKERGDNSPPKDPFFSLEELFLAQIKKRQKQLKKRKKKEKTEK